MVKEGGLGDNISDFVKGKQWLELGWYKQRSWERTGIWISLTDESTRVSYDLYMRYERRHKLRKIE